MRKLFDYNQPIIKTLSETDTYKIRMLYFLWKFVPTVKSRFAFTNRTTTVRLAERVNIEQVREELDFVKTLLSLRR